MMHALVIVLPFRLASRRDRRARVLTVLAIRAGLFALLGAWSIKALALYALAYMLFLHVTRFMDVHQHTYEVWETLEQPRAAQDARFDHEYEQRNTFSNPVSLRHPWLNLLMLNFGYHNAHHVRPTAPWHRLPTLDRELFGDDHRQVLPFGQLLRSYHRYRVPRVVNGDPPGIDVGDGRDFVGVVGVSFLTAH
jgi:fatty acid desaturase